jgi:hypothetical protein
MRHHLLSAFAVVASMLTTTPVFASPEGDHRCADLTKECFAYSRMERDECFKGVTSHPLCAGSRVAELAEKRLSLSPNAPDAIDGGPAFLGPQLVDSDCLANFDAAWSSALVQGLLSEDEYRHLSMSLDQCARIPASQVVRP